MAVTSGGSAGDEVKEFIRTKGINTFHDKIREYIDTLKKGENYTVLLMLVLTLLGNSQWVLKRNWHLLIRLCYKFMLNSSVLFCILTAVPNLVK